MQTKMLNVFQTDKLPRPWSIATTAEETERQEAVLELYMSKYDEMPRLDTLLPEEQPFQYVHWVVERYEVRTTGKEHSLVMRSAV